MVVDEIISCLSTPACSASLLIVFTLVVREYKCFCRCRKGRGMPVGWL